MCYLDTYSCTVECFNSNLNLTSAMNGTIESVGVYGSGCHVKACEVVGHYSNSVQQWDFSPIGVEGWIWLLGITLVITIVIVAVVYILQPLPPERKK